MDMDSHSQEDHDALAHSIQNAAAQLLPHITDAGLDLAGVDHEAAGAHEDHDVAQADHGIDLDTLGEGHPFRHHDLQGADLSGVGGLAGADGGGGGVDGEDTGEKGDDVEVDVSGLELPDLDDGDDDLDGALSQGFGDVKGGFQRPPSIRKACDLCHAAKQKCSGDRPACTRCAAGGWQCVYAPRQRRRTVPKEQKAARQLEQAQTSTSYASSTPGGPVNKKRKLAGRESVEYDDSGLDIKVAMGMAMDMSLGDEDEQEDLMSMSEDAMLESIAIDGFLADLPLSTFVHNLPRVVEPEPEPEPQPTFSVDDFPNAGEMDQHTTSALREAIFSLNESNNHGHDGEDHGDGTGENPDLDPHLALLDLTQMDGGDHGTDGVGAGLGDHQQETLHIPDFGPTPKPTGCNHRPHLPHILQLLTQVPLEARAGANTPLTFAVFAPLARSLRIFHAVYRCPSCSSNPRETLPQLALLSRTTTILTYPFPPLSSAVGSTAGITLHGARLTGTGISEAIEQHIVGVVWDSWRAALREIFAHFDLKAQEVIQAAQFTGDDEGEGGKGAAGEDGKKDGEKQDPTHPPQAQQQQKPKVRSSAETLRAGLMLMAITRLVTAMDEVEG